MALNTLILIPDKSSYSDVAATQTVGVKLDGGLSKYRRDQIGGGDLVNVQFTINRFDYEYLRAFFRTSVQQGSEAFLINLIIDDGGLELYESYFVPGSFRLASHRGATYQVSAQLEVKSPPPDTAFDETLILLVEEYGGGKQVLNMLNGFDKLVNIDFPDAIGLP